MAKQQRIEWANRAFLRGLAIGALVLTLLGSAWAGGSASILAMTPLAGALAFSLVGIVEVGLIVGCILLLRAAGRVPVDSSPESVARGRAIGRRLGIGFGIVFGSETLVIALSVGILSAAHLDDFVVPVTVLIVGLHFLPLAWLFHVWPYYVTGGAMSLVAIITLIAVPRTAMVNHTTLWVVVPATGSALVLWLTAVVVLVLGRQTVLRAAPQAA